jgi:branched-chain amino acid transport system permease protein
MTHDIQVLILGLLLGGVYALMASGLTLAFGVMRIVNLAHAVMIVGSAYIAYFIFQDAGIDPLLAVVIVAPIMFAIGFAAYMILFRRVEGSPRYVEMTVLMTFALAIIVEGLLGYFFTGIFRTTNPSYATEAIFVDQLFVPTGQLYAGILSIVLLGGLGLFLKFSRIGYGIRATMQNRDAAQIVGVDVRRISAISFGISAALAGASGALVSYLFPFFPARHWQWIAILLALVVLGGMGSLRGAVVGALLLAVISSFVVDGVGPTWGPMVFFVALFAILIVRPQGLFGQEQAI